MNSRVNLWKSDKGFIWMLVITLLSLISTQLPEGIIWESKFLLRLGFYLFILIAIRASSLSNNRKSTGYMIASGLLLLAITMIWTESYWLMLLYTVFSTSYLIFIIGLVVSQIFEGGKITVNKIIGGVATYLLIGHVWASLYLTIYIIDPSSFLHGGEVIRQGQVLKHLSYFSFVTLTTVGYGDIIPVGGVARIFVMIEGLIGQLFPAIFIAKLVALQMEHSKK